MLAACPTVGDARFARRVDRDGDGVAAVGVGGRDCDDRDPDVHPGAVDVPYDDVDADCSGGSDHDADGDGYDAASSGGDDCDDGDPDIHPGATDAAYDGVDSDCDASSDFDADGDGFDAEPLGGDDCNDADADVHPGAPDLPYDGVDSDCSGGSDDDADGDGHADRDRGGDDCDDGDGLVYPGAPDPPYDGVDADCSGGSDDDADGDGYDAAAHGGDDCDDTNAALHPGAPDAPYDGVDADCAGDTDFDADRDGHDASSHGGGDCDDGDPSVHPGAVDAPYDGLDADCSGTSDLDADGDGVDASAHGGTDCDDTDPAVGPDAPERCLDRADSDCDADRACRATAAIAGTELRGMPGEGLGEVLEVADLDGDGFGDALLGDGTDLGPRLFLGPPATWTLASPSATLLAEGPGDSVGSALAALADLDGDGWRELAVGADRWGAAGDRFGAVYLLSGPKLGAMELGAAPVRFRGAYPQGNLGSSVVGLGDFDGDGLPDLALGAAGAPDLEGADNAGRVYVTTPAVAGDVDPGDTASLEVVGDQGATGIGRVIARAGDTRGDGRDGVWLGSSTMNRPGGNSEGVAALFLSDRTGLADVRQADALLWGRQELSGAGSSVVGGHDADGDGISDVWVGAPSDAGGGQGRGAAFLVLGPFAGEVSLADAHAVLVGARDGDRVGGLGAAWDVDGDGVVDLWLGAPRALNDTGEAILVLGPFAGTRDLGFDADAVLVEGASADRFASAAAAGDLDADGRGDLLVSSAAFGAGAVWAVTAGDLAP